MGYMDNDELRLSDADFDRIRKRVYEVAGISLSDAKRTLVTSRLTKLVRELKLESFNNYIDFLERTEDGRHKQDFVNALTTNLTRFYREDHHFEHLVKHIGDVIARKPRSGRSGRPRLRIWSAGCSTGQEPYTITMCLLSRYPELKGWDFRVLATDIDTNVLAKAAKGIYAQGDLSGLSPERAKPFEPAGEGMVRIPDHMRAPIAFKPLNLMENWPFGGPFDAIFCRNVAIYFDKPTQTRLFERFADLLTQDGFLYIGHSENLGGSSAKFSLVGKTIYRPKPALSKTPKLQRGAA